MAGLPTTAACPASASTPTTDAGAVRRLRDAGAVVVGKTNLDQFATGLNGGRSPYGAPESVFRDELAADPVGRNLVLGRWTQFTSLLDLAAPAVPAGTTVDGRPVGVTFLGPAFSEDRLLAAAARLLPTVHPVSQEVP